MFVAIVRSVCEMYSGIFFYVCVSAATDAAGSVSVSAPAAAAAAVPKCEMYSGIFFYVCACY